MVQKGDIVPSCTWTILFSLSDVELTWSKYNLRSVKGLLSFWNMLKVNLRRIGYLFLSVTSFMQLLLLVKIFFSIFSTFLFLVISFLHGFQYIIHLVILSLLSLVLKVTIYILYIVLVKDINFVPYVIPKSKYQVWKGVLQCIPFLPSA